MQRIYRNFFFVEIAVIIAVTAVFKAIPERIVAGAVAGTMFVLLGLVIVGWGLKLPAVRRTPTFFAGLIHLFGSALPLMVTRFLNSAAVFEDVRVLGLPGPVFHQVSTFIYLGLMAATVFDWVRAHRAARAA
jgi:uncharacterized YccA/Bax inhibitor family protein